MVKRKFVESDFNGLWKKANLQQKSELFYYSLFDFQSFEDGVDSKVLTEIRTYRDYIPKAINKIDKFFFQVVDKSLFMNSASTDFLFRYILSWESKERGIKLETNISGFPDFIYNKEHCVEVKRLITTKNLYDYVNKIIEAEQNKTLKCLILVFPMLGQDKIYRIKDYTVGYYALARSLGCKIEVVHVDKANMNEVVAKIMEKLRSVK